MNKELEANYTQLNGYIEALQKQNRSLQIENRKLREGIITFNELLGLMNDKVKELNSEV